MKPDRPHSLFLADLHLAPDTPATTARFLFWLAEVAPAAEAVYILGDLFEAWPGDDFLADPFAKSLAGAMRDLTRRGTQLNLQHGNRDFLLGEAFLDTTGARLLPDSALINLHGTATLLLHGDSLCTDDLAYQQFRRQVRDPAWQQAVLAKPLAERLALARQLREQSEQAKHGKYDAIMDVNAEAVAAAFRQAACPRMIHGHTHRPARHVLTVDGQARERWVLPDWDENRGGSLRCDADGCVSMPY